MLLCVFSREGRRSSRWNGRTLRGHCRKYADSNAGTTCGDTTETSKLAATEKVRALVVIPPGLLQLKSSQLRTDCCLQLQKYQGLRRAAPRGVSLPEMAIAKSVVSLRNPASSGTVDRGGPASGPGPNAGFGDIRISVVYRMRDTDET